MRFTFGSVAVHFQQCCGPLSFRKKLKKRQQKLVQESLRPTKRNHEAHSTAWCSAVFSLKQCVLLSDERSTRLVNARKKLISMKKYNKNSWGSLLVVLRFTFGSVAVHSRSKKVKKKTTKSHMRKITSDKRNYAARLPIRCSAVFILKQCGRPYDVVHPVSAKKLLRKRKKVMRFTSW